MPENRWDSSTGIFSLLPSSLRVWGGQRSDTGQPKGSGLRTGNDGKTRWGNRSCLTQILTCRHPELPLPSNTKLIKRIIIKNTRYGKKCAYSWQFCKPSRRELRAAMMIPVIYEQLKRKKLKIHKARCVCECVLSGSKGWATRGNLKGLGSHLETPAFILQWHACQSSQRLRLACFQSSLAQQTLSLTLSCREIMKQNLCLGLHSYLWLPYWFLWTPSACVAFPFLLVHDSASLLMLWFTFSFFFFSVISVFLFVSLLCVFSDPFTFLFLLTHVKIVIIKQTQSQA